MRYILIFYFSLLACKDNKQSNSNLLSVTDTIFIKDTLYLSQQDVNWQQNLNLTHNTDLDTIWFKPVSYYISDKNCSGLAKDFYFGRLRPSDDGVTEELLKLATTDNEKLRPFYRWCLNTTIIIQDGALAEMTGVPARKYAEKFPEEFVNYMRGDTSGSRLADWSAAIAYSGFYDMEDSRKSAELQQKFLHKMRSNCKSCSKHVLNEIEAFSKMAFH